jgi:hypothetical protein
MSTLLDCREQMTVRGTLADPQLPEGSAVIDRRYGVQLPPSYVAFMELLGPGTLGGFLHVHPVPALQTHRERLQPFLDEALEALLDETGDVLIFADSDNGDMCGWHLADLRVSPEPVVVRVSDFESERLAASVTELIVRLTAGEDLFGVGALPRTYRCRTGA